MCGNHDYTSANIDMIFPAGSPIGTTRVYRIPIIDDNSVEQLTEDFTATSSSPNPDVNFVGGNTCTCRIMDNESKYDCIKATSG